MFQGTAFSLEHPIRSDQHGGNRRDDTPGTIFPTRLGCQKLIEFPKHKTGGDLVHAAVELTRREVATVVAWSAGEVLTTPNGHCVRPTRNAHRGIHRTEDAD